MNNADRLKVTKLKETIKQKVKLRNKTNIFRRAGSVIVITSVTIKQYAKPSGETTKLHKTDTQRDMKQKH